MKTDRELLALAAKTAFGSKNFVGDMKWNPLTDDGDALRLAVKLHLTILSNETASWIAHGMGQMNIAEEHHDGANPYSATRRAIVRAAAQIGEKLWVTKKQVGQRFHVRYADHLSA